MTGMEQFLAEQASTSEDVEKVAQAEFFLKLANKNGINLDALTDDQVNELWNATFSKTAEEEKKEDGDKETVEKAKEEHEKAKEGAAKVAEAEMMGRVMAESYVNHLQKIAAEGGLCFEGKAKDKEDDKKGKEDKEEEKKSSGSYLDALACQVALQKIAQAGFDSDEAAQRLNAVLTLGAGESEKIAQVQQFGDAVDVRSSELLEMAGYPIDWSGTPFAKEAAMKALPQHGTKRFAEKAWDVAKKFPGVKDISEGHKAKGIAKATGTVAAGGAAAYGSAKGIKALSKKKDEGGGEKQSSANFDIAAAQHAVEKAASVGWNADEAVERLNAVLTLGPGDPTASEKVAAAQSEEQALDMRACELLELAGYPITWN